MNSQEFKSLRVRCRCVPRSCCFAIQATSHLTLTHYITGQLTVHIMGQLEVAWC